MTSQTSQKTELHLIEYEGQHEFPNFYVFGNDHSFVIIAADDCVQPVLGYSTENPFGTGKIPENAFYWLKGYDCQIAFAVQSKQKPTAETSKQWNDLLAGKGLEPKSDRNVEPLIQTQWDQSPYYNDLCPYDNTGNQRTVTGCVATAMAQIMKYWAYPEHGIGDHAYTPETHPQHGVQYVNFAEATYNWSQMPNSISSSNTEIAKLMYHCGVSVDMDYDYSESNSSHTGSGAKTADVATALTKYFNYDTASYKTREEVGQDSTWISMMKAELDAGRPMQYSGRGNGGHSFVCDGYSDNDFFHFNWGWGGMRDGYFEITNLNPGGSGTGGGSYVYNNDQAAIFGIKPATMGTATAPTLTASLSQGEGTRNAILSWTTVTDAASYKLFRNNELIYTGTKTSYVDEHIPYGTNTYFVRSVDAASHLSWPSNYKSITITFEAPANVTAENTAEGIRVAWSAAEGSVAYNVYCNGILVGSAIQGTSYIDSRTIAGSLNYFVKGVDTLGDLSTASGTAAVTVDYETPSIDDLEVSLSNNDAVLSWTAPDWCFPETPSQTLAYGSGTFSYNQCLGTNGNGTLYWGNRYPTTTLDSYQGMKLYKISFYVAGAGSYQCLVYQGTQNDHPSTLLKTIEVLSSEDGWFNIILDEPITIDDSQDLWVFMYDPEYKNFPAAFISFNDHAEGCYYSTINPCNSLGSYAGVSWLIKAHFSDADYTYNVYDAETKLNGDTPIASTSYTASSPESGKAHLYRVKTVCNDSETNSNLAGLALGNSSLSSLSLSNNDMMYVAANSILNVTGDLSNDNPANLILEDGAQLIHSSQGVKAALRKAIQAYNEGQNDGWYTIASPVNEQSLETLATGTYDLYTYNEKDAYWMNQKDGNNSITQFAEGQGILYASAVQRTLEFSGDMKATNATVTIPMSYSSTEESLKGFNLAGNPFTRNLGTGDMVLDNTPITTYYIAEGGNDLTAYNISQRPIRPGEGFFIQATTSEDNLVFIPNSKGDVATPLAFISIEVDNGNSADRAYIQFGQGNTLRKMSLPENTLQLSLWHHDATYAAVTINEDEKEMPIHFKTDDYGRYTITVTPTNLDFSYLHLVDNLTGADVDLLETSSYTFEAEAKGFESRFKLLFDSRDLAEDSEPFASYVDGHIVVTGMDEPYVMQLIDMTGRIVEKPVPGVYVLRLITENETKTQKIIIK